LIRAAREVMGRLGADATTISAITAAAGVGKGSFYNHFDSKDALVEAVIDEMIAAFAAQILSLTDSLDDAAEVLAVSIRHFIRMATEEPEVGHFIVRGATGRALVEENIGPWAQRDVERGIADGRFQCDDKLIFAAILAGSAESVIRGVLDGRFAAEAGAELAASILKMLGVPSAEADALTQGPLAPIPDARSSAA
jgi:AcrR family transcriptional regulator